MAHRYQVTIVGYIIADDVEEVSDILDDVAGAGVNIALATADGRELWHDDLAIHAGSADD